MRRTIRLLLVGSALATLIVGSGFMMPVSPANAVVYCAAGLYHAGCVRRPPVARTTVVGPGVRCRYVVVNGVRVRRCY
jgi:hypothetical protein